MLMRGPFGFGVAFSLIIVALSSSPGLAAEARGYTVTDLGLGGSGVGINERGQIIVNTAAPGGRDSAALWEKGKTTPLPPLAGDTSSTARGINNQGQVVGVSSGDFNTRPHGVVWADGRVAALPTAPGTSASQASGINNRGQIVGQAGNRAVLWDKGAVTDLGMLPGDSQSAAVAINDNGQIVGTSVGSRSPGFPPLPRAVLWDRGTITMLGAAEWNKGSFERSVPTSINNRGQVVGYSDFGGLRGVLWEDGTMTALAELQPGMGSAARAYAINERGQIVGAAIPSGSGNTRPVLWDNGSVVDLGPAPGSTSASADQAWAINQAGQIVGQVGTRAVLWDRAH
jgi:probable HAF family extracellular repeat protein